MSLGNEEEGNDDTIAPQAAETRVRVGRPRGSLAFTSRKNLPEDWSKPLPGSYPVDLSRARSKPAPSEPEHQPDAAAGAADSPPSPPDAPESSDQEPAAQQPEEAVAAPEEPLVPPPESPRAGLLGHQRAAGSSTAPPLRLSKAASSRGGGHNPFLEKRPSLVKRASSTLASPRMMLKQASSALVQIQEGTVEVMHALRPGVDNLALGIDVLGLPPPPGGSAPPPPPVSERMLSSHFEEESLFEVEVDDEDAESLIAGEGLTSAVLREGTDADGYSLLDWSEEMLLLTHEPLRRDMLEMQRALQTRYFGDLPESWRVRAFFRFFHCWCLLVSQQHAVEVAVHYDWLVAPTGKVESETRRGVLAYHRKVELEMHSISRLENKILAELASIASEEPWSETAQELRTRINALCVEVRAHLSEQERLLPKLLRDHWGRISPPQLVSRSLKAAKGALAKGSASRAGDRPQLLMWVLHYLRRRDGTRARYLVAQLPMTTRLHVVLRAQKHASYLAYLRYIVHDEQPASSVVSSARAQPADPNDPYAPRKPDAGVGQQHEKERRAGMVNAMLAAANAERVDVPTSSAGPTRSLAESQTPAHAYADAGAWANRHNRVPSNIFKKIGIEAPSTPRRL